MRHTFPRYAAALALLCAVASATVARTAEYVALPGGTFESVLPADGKSADAKVAPFRLRVTPVTNGERCCKVQSGFRVLVSKADSRPMVPSAPGMS